MSVTSGYTDCACRDCFGLGISPDGYTLALCNDCEEAGCDEDGTSDCLAPEDDAQGPYCTRCSGFHVPPCTHVPEGEQA